MRQQKGRHCQPPRSHHLHVTRRRLEQIRPPLLKLSRPRSNPACIQPLRIKRKVSVVARYPRRLLKLRPFLVRICSQTLCINNGKPVNIHIAGPTHPPLSTPLTTPRPPMLLPRNHRHSSPTRLGRDSLHCQTRYATNGKWGTIGLRHNIWTTTPPNLTRFVPTALYTLIPVSAVLPSNQTHSTTRQSPSKAGYAIRKAYSKMSAPASRRIAEIQLLPIFCLRLSRTRQVNCSRPVSSRLLHPAIPRPISTSCETRRPLLSHCHHPINDAEKKQSIADWGAPCATTVLIIREESTLLLIRAVYLAVLLRTSLMDPVRFLRASWNE